MSESEIHSAGNILQEMNAFREIHCSYNDNSIEKKYYQIVAQELTLNSLQRDHNIGYNTNPRRDITIGLVISGHIISIVHSSQDDINKSLHGFMIEHQDLIKETMRIYQQDQLLQKLEVFIWSGESILSQEKQKNKSFLESSDVSSTFQQQIIESSPSNRYYGDLQRRQIQKTLCVEQLNSTDYYGRLRRQFLQEELYVLQGIIRKIVIQLKNKQEGQKDKSYLDQLDGKEYGNLGFFDEFGMSLFEIQQHYFKGDIIESLEQKERQLFAVEEDESGEEQDERITASTQEEALILGLTNESIERIRGFIEEQENEKAKIIGEKLEGSKHEMKIFLNNLKTIEMSKRQYLWREGDEFNGIYFIVSGLHQGFIGEEYIFDESNTLARRTYSASVATPSARLYFISNSGLQTMKKQIPQIIFQLQSISKAKQNMLKQRWQATLQLRRQSITTVTSLAKQQQQIETDSQEQFDLHSTTNASPKVTRARAHTAANTPKAKQLEIEKRESSKFKETNDIKEIDKLIRCHFGKDKYLQMIQDNPDIILSNETLQSLESLMDLSNDAEGQISSKRAAVPQSPSSRQQTIASQQSPRFNSSGSSSPSSSPVHFSGRNSFSSYSSNSRKKNTTDLPSGMESPGPHQKANRRISIAQSPLRINHMMDEKSPKASSSNSQHFLHDKKWAGLRKYLSEDQVSHLAKREAKLEEDKRDVSKLTVFEQAKLKENLQLKSIRPKSSSNAVSTMDYFRKPWDWQQDEDERLAQLQLMQLKAPNDYILTAVSSPLEIKALNFRISAIQHKKKNFSGGQINSNNTSSNHQVSNKLGEKSVNSPLSQTHKASDSSNWQCNLDKSKNGISSSPISIIQETRQNQFHSLQKYCPRPRCQTAGGNNQSTTSVKPLAEQQNTVTFSSSPKQSSNCSSFSKQLQAQSPKVKASAYRLKAKSFQASQIEVTEEEDQKNLGKQLHISEEQNQPHLQEGQRCLIPRQSTELTTAAFTQNQLKESYDVIINKNLVSNADQHINSNATRPSTSLITATPTVASRPNISANSNHILNRPLSSPGLSSLSKQRQGSHLILSRNHNPKYHKPNYGFIPHNLFTQSSPPSAQQHHNLNDDCNSGNQSHQQAQCCQTEPFDETLFPTQLLQQHQQHEIANILSRISHRSSFSSGFNYLQQSQHLQIGQQQVNPILQIASLNPKDIVSMEVSHLRRNSFNSMNFHRNSFQFAQFSQQLQYPLNQLNLQSSPSLRQQFLRRSSEQFNPIKPSVPPTATHVLINTLEMKKGNKKIQPRIHSAKLAK